ncbi:MAG: flippase-like domain-containing protein, partial [Actinomycetota bacterium]|nr:flippase-like domain-containing protein [Actinomycetota bacterium]
GLLGAVAWWAGDVAVLLACLHAFGASPPVAIVVVSYFVGMLANLLPLPGGVGGVDGGMVGALVLFGVDPATAVVGVLAYRGFAFWLPIAPGVLAFFALRRTVARWGREDDFAATPGPVPCPAATRERTRAWRGTPACSPAR